MSIQYNKFSQCNLCLYNYCLANNITWVHFRSKSLDLADRGNPKADKYLKADRFWVRERMVNSKDMKEVIIQVAIHTVMVVVRAIREAYLPIEPHIRRTSETKARWINSESTSIWQESTREVCETIEFWNRGSRCTPSESILSKWWRKVQIIKKWLDREGLQFIQTPTNAEKDTCKSAKGLFNVPKENLWPQNMIQRYV